MKCKWGIRQEVKWFTLNSCLFNCVCVHTHVCACADTHPNQVPVEARGINLELWEVMSGPYMDPLQEQYLLITTEPSLQYHNLLLYMANNGMRVDVGTPLGSSWWFQARNNEARIPVVLVLVLRSAWFRVAFKGRVHKTWTWIHVEMCKKWLQPVLWEHSRWRYCWLT